MWEYVPTEELQHYGVAGMKWGVRKDAYDLANHRRNQAVFEAKRQFKRGEISKEKKKATIREANQTLKKSNSVLKAEYKVAKKQGRKKEFQKNIQQQARDEVRNKTALRVGRTLNAMTTVGTLAGVASGATVAMVASPAVAGLALGAAAVTTATTAGKHYLVNKGLDKLA